MWNSHSELRFHIVVQDRHGHEDTDEEVCDTDDGGDKADDQYDSGDDGEDEEEEEDNPDDLIEQGVLTVGDLLVNEECDKTDDDAHDTRCGTVPEAEDTLNDLDVCEDLNKLADDIEFIAECSVHDTLSEAEVKECSDKGTHTSHDDREVSLSVINEFTYNAENCSEEQQECTNYECDACVF